MTYDICNTSAYTAHKFVMRHPQPPTKALWFIILK